MALVFDIETVGEAWDALDETTQSALTRWIKREAKSEEEYRVSLADIKQGLGLSPLTGFIVAIGVYDTEREKGAVYFSAPGKDVETVEEGGIKYKAMDEKDMLEAFWTGAKEYNEFVTYNGRGFDAPFIALRSMVHGVKPTRDLLEGRYLYQQRSCKHIDLQEQLTFYGAWNKKPSLHLFCRALGIESPKAGGTTGDDVALLYREGKYSDIAHYNAGDLFATAALYKRWQETFR
ncbi:MAG: ribonuclease H-like domain-containing protein [Minisyncoccota bacterium]